MLRQIGISFSTLALFFIMFFFYTKLAGPLPFFVDSVTTTKATTFDVVGEGKASIIPDNAKISAGVSATGPSAEDVKNQINAVINKVSSSIKAQGVDPSDIQTANYNVNPTYDYSSGSQKITGYSANTTLTVTVKDLSKLNQIIDAATAAGATNVNNLGLTSSNQASAEDTARKEAIANAKKKAKDIADSAGFKLGNLVNYSETNGGVPRPIPLSAGIKNQTTPTQIETGSNEVTIDVTLSYEVR